MRKLKIDPQEDVGLGGSPAGTIPDTMEQFPDLLDIILALEVAISMSDVKPWASGALIEEMTEWLVVWN